MDLATLFATFESSAFRLEGLSSYIVPEETEAIAQFNHDGSVPPGFNKDWVTLIRHAVDDGKTISRLRLLSDPLSAYEKFELKSYASNIEAGEKIHIFHRKGQPYQSDYWLFDDLYMAEMKYAPDGKWLGADVRTVTGEDVEMIEYWQALYELSFKLGVA